MKKCLATACLTALALLGLAQVSEANGGLFRRNRGCCDAPCAQTAPAPAPAPQYEERKVTVYKQVMKEKEIEVLECKRVMVDEKFTYTVCTPVWTDQKRKVTVCTPTQKEVDYTYTIMTPKVVQKEVQVTTYNCITENVVEKFPVCRTVCVTYIDECG